MKTTRGGRAPPSDGDRAYRNPAIPDNPNLARLFSLREIAEKTGLSARGLQWWTEHGLLECDAPDARTGRGVHRYFHAIEVQIASLLAALSAGEMPATMLQKFATVFRASLRSKPLAEMPVGLVVDDWPEISRVMFRAARGEGLNFLLVPFFAANPAKITAITDEAGPPTLDLMAVFPQDLPYGSLGGAGFLSVIEMTSRLAPLFA
jgi:hypothetical protein